MIWSTFGGTSIVLCPVIPIICVKMDRNAWGFLGFFFFIMQEGFTKTSKIMKLLFRALNGLFSIWFLILCFPGLYWPPLAITKLLYRSKLVYFWWKATLPLGFQIWTFFVNSWMDCDKEDATDEIENQLDDKTVIIITTLEGTSMCKS